MKTHKTIQNWQIRWLKNLKREKNLSQIIYLLLFFLSNHSWLKNWNQAFSKFDSNQSWLQNENQVLSKFDNNNSQLKWKWSIFKIYLQSLLMHGFEDAIFRYMRPNILHSAFLKSRDFSKQTKAKGTLNKISNP